VIGKLTLREWRETSIQQPREHSDLQEVPGQTVGPIQPRSDEDLERLIALRPFDRLAGRPRHSHLGSRHRANHIIPDGLARSFVQVGDVAGLAYVFARLRVGPASDQRTVAIRERVERAAAARSYLQVSEITGFVR
jgi:hypothetical protein